MTQFTNLFIIILLYQLLIILPSSHTLLTFEECKKLHQNLTIESIGVLTSSNGMPMVHFGQKYAIVIRDHLRHDIPEIVKSQITVTNEQSYGFFNGGHLTDITYVQLFKYRYQSFDKTIGSDLINFDINSTTHVTGFTLAHDQFCRIVDNGNTSKYYIECTKLTSSNVTYRVNFGTTRKENIPIMTYQLATNDEVTRVIACFAQSRLICGIYRIHHDGSRQQSLLYRPNHLHRSMFHWFGCPPIDGICGEPHIDSAYTKLNGDLVLLRGHWMYTFRDWTSKPAIGQLPDPTPLPDGYRVYDSIYECPNIGLIEFRFNRFVQILPNSDRKIIGEVDEYFNIDTRRSRIDAAYCTNSSSNSNTSRGRGIREKALWKAE